MIWPDLHVNVKVTLTATLGMGGSRPGMEVECSVKRLFCNPCQMMVDLDKGVTYERKKKYVF